jgi:glycosyltransferase involved in cell wall biosynthesis
MALALTAALLPLETEALVRRRLSGGDGVRASGRRDERRGLPDLVVDGETGLVVPPRDASALRDALERLLGDRELRRRLGAAGRERARCHFSWDTVTDATLEIYRMAA